MYVGIKNYVKKEYIRMNIMKTNMLLLDNKIMKEEGEKQTQTVSLAPVNSKEQSLSGMRALMFQGMKNLMADPELAQEVGVNGGNDGNVNENNDAAKKYVAPFSSNISFQSHKMRNVAAAAMLALATLTSCEKYVVNQPPAENKTEVTVTVTNQNEMAAFISMMQNYFTQALLQGQMNYELWQKYMEDTEAWRKQVDSKFDSIALILKAIEGQMIDANGKLDESNAITQTILTMLENKGYSHSEAINLILQGMDKVIEALGIIHNDLGVLIAQGEAAAEERALQSDMLYNIMITGQATKEGIDALNSQMDKTTNKFIEIAQGFSAQLNQIGANITDAIGYLAEQNKCTREQVIKSLQALGIKIDNNTAAQYITSGMLSGQLAAIQHELQRQTKEIQEARKDMSDLKAYAKEILDVTKSIEGRIGVFMEDFNTFATQANEAWTNLQALASKANVSLEEIQAAQKTYIKQMEQLKGIALQISKDVKSIDKNTVKTREDLLAALGIQTVVLDRALQFLGYTVAEYSTWNADRIINAFNKAIDGQNQLIDKNGKKLDEISDKISKILDNTDLDKSAKLDEIIKLLQGIDAKLSAFVEDWANARDALFAKLGQLQSDVTNILKEEKFQSEQMATLRGDIQGIAKDLKTSTSYLEKIYEKIQNNEPLTKEDMEEIAKRYNTSLQASLGEITALIKENIKLEKGQAEKLDSIDAKLANLGTISASILAKLQNLDLSKLDTIINQIDALTTVVKNLAANFDNYAKLALKAYNDEVTILNGISEKLDSTLSKINTLIVEVKRANIKLGSIDTNLTLLMNEVKTLQTKLGRTITPEELDSILSKHDAANQAFYADLISKVKINPADYSSLEAYLKAIHDVLVAGQKETNDNIIKILEWLKNHPDRAQDIIDAINNKEFNVVVTCDCDCKNNDKFVDEGEIGIIK